MAAATEAQATRAAAWLQALPMAAALLDDDRQCCANEAFETLCREARRVNQPDLETLIREARAQPGAVVRVGSAIDGRCFAVETASLAGRPALTLVVLTETTAVTRAHQLLSRQMVDDPLTGLPNRAGFVELLDGWLREGACGAVLIDLRRFSRVNDCIGSLGGDELLVTVARRLRGGLRAGDVLARLGVDEFAVAVRGADSQATLLKVGERLEAALVAPFRLSDFEIKVDAALGGAVAAQGEEAETLVRQAQLALKTAKTSRRIELYQPAALATARRRFSVETELRRAIEQEALDLAFQPFVALDSGRVIGFEALCRWQHPVLGQVPTPEFIAVAEESGLIIPLGRWVLERAAAALKRWDCAAGRALPLHVAVNLSAVQLAREDVGRLVDDVLRRHDLPGHRLSLELTEGMVVADPERAGRLLGAVKESAAQIAMDDFGTGYSNLATLQRLPIDVLKIDRSLVDGLLEDNDKRAIVEAIQLLARALGLRVTAEGIETVELARALAQLGCATGQGYYFAKPLPEPEALALALAADTAAFKLS